MNKGDLQRLARTIRNATYNSYCATLIGTAPECVRRLGERHKELKIGDMVVETSTLGMVGRPDWDGVGYLLRIEWEKVDFGPGAEPWDETAEGRPHPTEKVYYIQTLDDREFRWSNASMISVASERLPL